MTRIHSLLFIQAAREEQESLPVRDAVAGRDRFLHAKMQILEYNTCWHASPAGGKELIKAAMITRLRKYVRQTPRDCDL